MSATPLRIASAHGVPGTAGALVVGADGLRCVLTNHHVMFGGGAVVGDRVWALAPEDEIYQAREAVCLGRARSGQIGRVTFNDETYFVDCAVVAIADETLFPVWLKSVLSETWPLETAGAEPGMSVFKCGAGTEFTEGTVVDVAYPDHPFIDGRSWSAPGQLLVDSRDPELNFSAPGDSGAALLDGGGRIIGLLWGSTANGQGIACPIEPVLDCLKVTLVAAPARMLRYT